MPWTYYAIGAVLQFVGIVLIRFSYHILLVEKKKLSREARVECVVIGSGDLGKKVVRHLEENTPYKPSLIIGRESGRSMDGISVIEMDLEKIKGKPVFIADKELQIKGSDPTSAN